MTARLAQPRPALSARDRSFSFNTRLVSKVGVAAGAVVLSLVGVLPASAAAGDTATTFAVNAGTLSITLQPSASLTSAASGASSVSGTLGSVSVSDTRGNRSTWSANATSTTFTDSTGTTTSTGVTYTAGAMTTTGTTTIAAGTATTLTGVATKVAGPTAVTGNNTATWNPTLLVALPANALAGNYSGVVNTSVA
jgi:hypothetical protein